MRKRSKSISAVSGSIKSTFDDDDEVSDYSKINTQKEIEISTEDEMEIMSRIWTQLPKDDNLPYEKRIKEINWKKVVFGKYGVEDLKSHFKATIQNYRTYRVLAEILKDIEKDVLASVSLPQKPTNALSLYISEHKDNLKKELENSHEKNSFFRIASEHFKQLNKQKQEEYKKRSQEIRKEYNAVMEKFNLDLKFKKRKQNKTIKDSPFFLYCTHKTNLGTEASHHELKKEYLQLNKKEKLKWILHYFAITNGDKLNLEQYVKAKQNLTKDEMAILDDYEKRPKLLSGYNYFIKDFLANESRPNILHRDAFKAAIEQWKTLSEKEKLKYEEHSKKMRQLYDENLRDFLDSLPEDRLQYELEKNKLKRKVKSKINEVDTISKTNKSKSTLDGKLKSNDTALDVSPANVNGNNSFKSELLTSDDEKQLISPSQSKNSESFETSTPLETANEKKNKKRKISDASDNIRCSEGTKPIPENDMVVKSKSRNNSAKKEKLQTIEKFPTSAYRYFVSKIYNGPKNEAKKAYNLLSKKKKRAYVKVYEEELKKYLEHFEGYVKTLTSDELEIFRTKFKTEDEDSPSSSDSESDSSSDSESDSNSDSN